MGPTSLCGCHGHSWAHNLAQPSLPGKLKIDIKAMSFSTLVSEETYSLLKSSPVAEKEPESGSYGDEARVTQ